jgi:hypothetical protein
LYAAEKEPCSGLEADGGEQRIRDEYDVVINAIDAPVGWEEWQLRIVPDVLLWNAANLDADPDVEYYFGTDCDPSLSLQLIKLEVRSPSGDIIENVEIVK